eukprot:scaffold97430_cov30-Attheya_sp.AAC.1
MMQLQSPVPVSSKYGWTVVMLSILQLLSLSTGPCFADALQLQVRARARPFAFGPIRCMFWMLILIPSGGRKFLAEANVVSAPLVQFAPGDPSILSVPSTSTVVNCVGITRGGFQSCGGGGSFDCEFSGVFSIIGDCSCVGAVESGQASEFTCGANGDFGGNGTIGSSACNNGGHRTCGANGFGGGVGVIGNDSCNDGDANTCRFNGRDGKGMIGNGSCNNAGQSPSCQNNGGGQGGDASIGDAACNGPNNCNDNQGTIASGCCNGDTQCNNNGSGGKISCSGDDNIISYATCPDLCL